MKKLLFGIYIYMGSFFAICLAWWMMAGDEPTALIAGISAAVGVESVAAGVIRVYENKINNNFNKEMIQLEQNQLDTETGISEAMVCHPCGFSDDSCGDLRGRSGCGNDGNC